MGSTVRGEMGRLLDPICLLLTFRSQWKQERGKGGGLETGGEGSEASLAYSTSEGSVMTPVDVVWELSVMIPGLVTVVVVAGLATVVMVE